MATLTVGANQAYTTIEAAVAASSAGDTVVVDAGTYTNDFVSISHNLTLEAAAGATVDLVATQDPPNGKAIIDEGGTGVTVTIQGLDISGAVVNDGNGAAIRYEGGTLTLTGDTIHGNQDGLLGAADPNGSITINQSDFYDNGAGDGYTHNIYVGAINSLTVENSTITDANVGHDIKSRAANNTIIDNTISDGPNGTASYEIDLPNGGNALISGNTIEKGANASNSNAISFGEEGNLYAGSSLVVQDNTLINDDTNNPTTAVVNRDAAVTAQVTGNQVHDFTYLTSGPATASNNTDLATESSVACYCAGTRIATPTGEVAVEALRAGDPILTASGQVRQIRWIGHRSYAARFVRGNRNVLPIQVAAGALADGIPVRDLFVSPEHALLLDGLLVRARDLVNGSSISQVAAYGTLSYFHVELDSHDVLLAEGAPAESFVDDNSRGLFHNAAGHAAADRPAEYCAPRVDCGYRLQAIRERLGRRAAQCSNAA